MQMINDDEHIPYSIWHVLFVKHFFVYDAVNYLTYLVWFECPSPPPQSGRLERY